MRLFILIMCLWTGLAQAGDWSSGGGEILRTANNPWFVENTKVIHYCVIADPERFGDIPYPVTSLIEQAYSYWATSLANAAFQWEATPAGRIKISLGTQALVYQKACDSNSDIAFYFGELPPDLGRYILNPSEYVGVTVRTDYDETNLKGKGYIYISADSGPLMYETEQLAPGAWHWGQGGTLLRVLLHEFGHVFGLQHISEHPVMDAEFPKKVVRDGSWVKAIQSLDIRNLPIFEGIRSDGLVAERCLDSSHFSNWAQIVEYFELPANLQQAACYRVIYDVHSRIARFYFDATLNDKMPVLGEGRFQEDADISGGLGPVIWIPETQNVFPLKPFQELPGPLIKRRQVSLIYTAPSGKTHPMILQTTPEQWDSRGEGAGVIHLSGDLDGKLILNLLY